MNKIIWDGYLFYGRDNPFVLFRHWMSEAEKEINDPNAVACTVNNQQMRMVLLKNLIIMGFFLQI